jgi:hypothetical protein
VSDSKPGEESVAGFGEYGQVSGAVGWLPVLDVNVCGLKIAGEAVQEEIRGCRLPGPRGNSSDQAGRHGKPAGQVPQPLRDRSSSFGLDRRR